MEPAPVAARDRVDGRRRRRRRPRRSSWRPPPCRRRRAAPCPPLRRARGRPAARRGPGRPERPGEQAGQPVARREPARGGHEQRLLQPAVLTIAARRIGAGRRVLEAQRSRPAAPANRAAITAARSSASPRPANSCCWQSSRGNAPPDQVQALGRLDGARAPGRSRARSRDRRRSSPAHA